MTTLSASDLTFGKLKELHGSSLEAIEYLVDNGSKVAVKRKVSYASKNVLKSAYLHIQWIDSKGRAFYYREQKDGTFKGGQVQ